MTGQPIRVAQVIDALNVGGAERLVARLAQAAAAAPEVDMVVVTLRESDTSFLIDEIERHGTPVRCVPARTRHHLADVTLLPRLRTVLRRHDVVQCHLGTANIIGVLAARSLGRPVVSTLHSVGLSAGEQRPGRLRSFASDMALRHGPSKVVAVGEAVRQAHLDHTGPDRTVVIPNPAPAASAVSSAERRTARRALGDPDGPVLVALGRLEPAKGLDIALDALGRLQRSATLVVAGDGSLRPDLERRAAELGVLDRVRFLGQVSDVRYVLAGADVFVSSSRREGMPMAILEAMAAGLPVVATDVGDVARTVSGAGAVVPPGDPGALAAAIEAVLQDDVRRDAMAAESLRLATEEFDEQTWLRRWIDLWASVLPSTPAGSRLRLTRGRRASDRA